MSRGITLSESEIEKVRELLDEREENNKNQDTKAKVGNIKEKKKTDWER